MSKKKEKKKVVHGYVTGVQEDGPVYHITIQMTLDQLKPLVKDNLFKMVAIQVGPVD